MSTYPVLRVESKADRTLAKIPLAVRMKLDLARCKISLSHWRAIEHEQRQMLFAMRTETGTDIERFGATLADALRAAGCPPPLQIEVNTEAWEDAGPVPSSLEQALQAARVVLDWNGLDRFGRFVICSIARKGDPELLRDVAAELSSRQP